jgi:hypothetical protein
MKKTSPLLEAVFTCRLDNGENVKDIYYYDTKECSEN